EDEVRVRTVQLHATEKRYRTLFEDAPVGLFEASPTGEMLVANRAMLDLLGFASQKEMRAARLKMRGAITDEELGQLIPRLRNREAVCSQEASWSRPDGSVVLVRETLKAVTCSDGDIIS